mmetsp:Transcript_21765/g.29936  ORF Transcript_21765/g.29936 Transcript_21765/m.29936 type:complete len:124 (-) Transcript_21765:338-709(-)
MMMPHDDPKLHPSPSPIPPPQSSGQSGPYLIFVGVDPATLQNADPHPSTPFKPVVNPLMHEPEIDTFGSFLNPTPSPQVSSFSSLTCEFQIDPFGSYFADERPPTPQIPAIQGNFQMQIASGD